MINPSAWPPATGASRCGNVALDEPCVQRLERGFEALQAARDRDLRNCTLDVVCAIRFTIVLRWLDGGMSVRAACRIRLVA